MARLRFTGEYPMEFPTLHLACKPGDEVEVPDDVEVASPYLELVPVPKPKPTDAHVEVNADA